MSSFWTGVFLGVFVTTFVEALSGWLIVRRFRS